MKSNFKTKTTKTTTNTTTSNKSYTKIATGVYMTPAGNYRVRKTTNGTTFSKTFTNKAKAIAYYKGL